MRVSPPNSRSCGRLLRRHCRASVRLDQRASHRSRCWSHAACDVRTGANMRLAIKSMGGDVAEAACDGALLDDSRPGASRLPSTTRQLVCKRSSGAPGLRQNRRWRRCRRPTWLSSVCIVRAAIAISAAHARRVRLHEERSNSTDRDMIYAATRGEVEKPGARRSSANGGSKAACRRQPGGSRRTRSYLFYIHAAPAVANGNRSEPRTRRAIARGSSSLAGSSALQTVLTLRRHRPHQAVPRRARAQHRDHHAQGRRMAQPSP